ncbi:hypothetical protein SRHO_G00020290 [Serrasalmus rhombeus]
MKAEDLPLVSARTELTRIAAESERAAQTERESKRGRASGAQVESGRTLFTLICVDDLIPYQFHIISSHRTILYQPFISLTSNYIRMHALLSVL